ncbi:MAG: phospholipase D family protein, partial [Gemmatimonadales bacterium]
MTLLTVPLAFTQFEWGDADGKPASNPPLLLEAIRRNADRLTVFCQAGRAFAPALHGSLLTYLEGSVVEVTAPAEHGIFHPKVWLVRYLDEEGRVFYRLACLTRNLTGDTSWDLSVVLEGELAERENGFSVNRPLVRFFATLPDLAVQRADPVTLERARRMADEVRKVRFKGPADFDSVAFWPMGIDGVKRDPLPDQWTRALYVAPFVSASFLDRFDLSGDILVSRQEELDKLEPQVLHDLEKIYVLAPAAVADAPDEADGPDAESGLSGLHAKLYVFDMGWETAVLVGSANATGAAFERNVEFLVELRGKKSKVGIDQVLAQAPGQAGLIDLLSEYSPPAEPAPLDELGQELEAVVDQTRLVLAKAGLRARVDAEDEGLFALTLMPAGSPTLPDGVSAAVWPVTLPAVTITKPFVGGVPLRFGAVP